MQKIIALFLFLAYAGFSQQDLSKNFSPLKSSGNLPDIFTENIRNVIQKDISELNSKKESDKSLKRTYLLEANYEIEKIVKSGNTLINDEITVYLNKLADIVLKNNPGLRNELRIYALKTSVVNAYSYDKGYIFIDVGLIAQVESEAQLAYILCHEISHYIKKHNINGYVQNEKIDRENYKGKSAEDKLIAKCQYSKEQESEADLEGFKLFEQTSYDFKQAEKAFDVLQYSHLPFELIEFKKAFFETENYKLPKGYFLKEVASIRNNSNEDDTKHTHPNTAKRKQAIQELISNRSNAGKTNSITGQANFEYVRDLARLELCRLYLKDRDYPNALYAAYIMANKYPDNQYVIETISKCMYALTLYNKGKIRYTSDSYLENGFPNYADVESFPQQLYHLIYKMPENEWTIMSLNYVYRAHKRFPENKFISAYSDSLLALMKETNWGITDFVRIDKRTEQPDTIQKQAEVPGNSVSKTELIQTIQKENNFRNDDTVYYKRVYVDLFMTDPVFVSKFPSSGIKSETSGFSSYTVKNDAGNLKKKKSKKGRRKSKKSEYITTDSIIEKVLLLEPFYMQIDLSQKEEKLKYAKSDEKQETLIVTINDCAKLQNFQLVTLDPGIVTATEVDKINDYSVLTDWFSERFDGNDYDKNLIFNTNDVDGLITKYGTQYVMKTGIVTFRLKKGKKYTYYYSYVYDLRTNDIVYKKYEAFRDKDSKALINAKVYQTFYELIHAN
jgi:Zn-dependent protease with chaperone function